MEGTFFIICYPSGDESKLAVAEISYACDYEKKDYRLASRHDYVTREDAVRVARDLAKKHGKEYEAEAGEHNFLD
jgi:hypothetical protein